MTVNKDTKIMELKLKYTKITTWTKFFDKIKILNFNKYYNISNTKITLRHKINLWIAFS